MDLSQLSAKIIESITLLYSLSIDPTYIDRETEVYVTYHDGIICEVEGSDEKVLKYRRKIMNQELVKRSVLD